MTEPNYSPFPGLEPADMKMLGTKQCSVCTLFTVGVWQFITHVENTKPVWLAMCPRCDQLTPS